MHDARLLGRWQSNGPKTRREIAARRDLTLTPAFGRLFGKLELRFTRTRCYITLKGQTRFQRYVVLAKNATSVATLSDGEISHIHFEGSGFWIAAGNGKIREFFRRVK